MVELAQWSQLHQAVLSEAEETGSYALLRSLGGAAARLSRHFQEQIRRLTALRNHHFCYEHFDWHYYHYYWYFAVFAECCASPACPLDSLLPVQPLLAPWPHAQPSPRLLAGLL